MRPLRIAIIAGEESGDLLGADLVRSLRAAAGREVELVGVGGAHLQAQGLVSLFDPGQIALMGVTAVLRDLPRLVYRIGQTARTIVAAKPDCLVTIDSPDFNLRVSRKVRDADPSIPIVKYVSPSVWAWRPGRAPRMKPFIDHVLCILPFEPAALERLGGPPGTYVGHRMTHDPGLRAAAEQQKAHRPGATKRLVVLPGSRRGEVKGLLAPFGRVVSILAERGHALDVTVPTVPHVEPLVREGVANWAVAPTLVSGAEAKWAAFGTADAALAASGTVGLELALSGLPFLSCYKNDMIARTIMGMITTWSASLPNIIVDRPVVPEFYDDAVRPPMMARYVEALMAEGHVRAAQREGFDAVRAAMATERPSGEIAADVVLRHIRKA